MNRLDGANVSSHYEFRADKFSYVALGGVWLVLALALMFLDVFGKKQQHGQIWPVSGFLFALFLGVSICIRSYRIMVRDGVLSYRFLFHRTRAIRISDIAQARVDVRLGRTPPRRPPYALFIEPLPGLDAKPIAINMKFLSRKDLRTLFDLLGDKVGDEKHLLKGVLGKGAGRT